MGRRQYGRPSSQARRGGGGKLKDALLWWIDKGEAYRAAKEKAETDGQSIPESDEPPEIMDGYAGWYEDFWRLSSERQIGFGAGPIPGSAIDRHVAGWPHEDAEVFEFCIREMDGVFLMKSNKAEDPDKPQVVPGPPPRFADLAGKR